MTDDELKAIEARADAATKGPWGAYCIPRGQYPMYGVAQTTGDKLVICDMSGVDAPEANANHIAHSRTDIPALCAEVRRLRRLSAESLHRRCVDETAHSLNASDVKDNK